MKPAEWSNGFLPSPAGKRAELGPICVHTHLGLFLGQSKALVFNRSPAEAEGLSKIKQQPKQYSLILKITIHPQVLPWNWVSPD